MRTLGFRVFPNSLHAMLPIKQASTLTLLRVDTTSLAAIMIWSSDGGGPRGRLRVENPRYIAVTKVIMPSRYIALHAECTRQRYCWFFIIVPISSHADFERAKPDLSNRGHLQVIQALRSGQVNRLCSMPWYIGDTSITIIFTVIVGSEHTAIHKGHGMGTSSPSVSARSNWFHAVLNEAVGFGHPAPYVVDSRICHCFISIQREVIAAASRMMNRWPCP